MRVHYLLRGDRYWSSILDEHESHMVQERLIEDGVMLHTNAQVGEVYGRRAVEGVLTLDGQKIKGRMAAFAVGIRPRLELARSADLFVKRGIQVNEFLQTSQPDIYAAGDGAELTDPASGKGVLESLWYPARLQGQVAGQNMAGGRQSYQRISPYNVTRLAGIVTTIIGQVGQEKKDPDRDTNGIMRGDSEVWRQVSEAMVAQNSSGNNRLRLYVAEKTLRGALVMGDQTLSRPLQHLIADQVDISSIRPALLAPDADLTKIIQIFQKVVV
jgi:NAD(P)H-nitrite reductase large subunit